MKRDKWYLLKITDEKYMVIWNVKDEEEAIIVVKAHIIRHDLDIEFKVESIEEIQSLTDPRLAGINPILANN